MAFPPLTPGYQASTRAAMPLRQGVSTGAAVSSTTTVRGLAARTRSISASRSPPSLLPQLSPMHGLSVPSEAASATNTTATSDGGRQRGGLVLVLARVVAHLHAGGRRRGPRSRPSAC